MKDTVNTVRFRVREEPWMRTRKRPKEHIWKDTEVQVLQKFVCINSGLSKLCFYAINTNKENRTRWTVPGASWKLCLRSVWHHRLMFCLIKSDQFFSWLRGQFSCCSVTSQWLWAAVAAVPDVTMDQACMCVCEHTKPHGLWAVCPDPILTWIDSTTDIPT